MPADFDNTGASWRGLLERLRGEDFPQLLPGEVWLVGAGPGDPGLLTLDALAGLAQADVVFHDALIDPRVLALARPEAERLLVGKRGGQPSTAQDQIVELLINSASRGDRVLRLKGGDPFIFGRGGEEMLALAAAGVSVRVVSGVTSGLAALTVAGIPATMRGINQAILLATGHGPTESDIKTWVALARAKVPIAFYMATRNLDSIAHSLLRGEMPGDTPTAIIASATLPGQQVLVAPLDQLVERASGLSGPAIVVIGEIVRMRSQLLTLVSAVRSQPGNPLTALAAAT
jgi:uroporphyrin-III C-methyltransferase